MPSIFQQLLILYVFIAAGWIIGKAKKGQTEHNQVLSVLLVTILLPCKVFRSFAANFTVEYLSQRYVFLIASTVLLGVLVALARFGSRLFSKHEYQRKVYHYCIVITNYAYLGYVLIEAVFGEKMLADFMFFAIPFIIYTYTMGYALLTGGKNPLKRLINPVTVAIVLGMITGLTGLKLPDFLQSVISMASACVGPLSMLLTGMTLSGFKLKELVLDWKVFVFAFIRLLALPGVIYLACRGLGLNDVLPMMVIITCMPCGLNTIVFPKLINQDCSLGARLALITHVFALPTLFLWLTLIQ